MTVVVDYILEYKPRELHAFADTDDVLEFLKEELQGLDTPVFSKETGTYEEESSDRRQWI